MPCGCGGKSWVATRPDGTQSTYRSEYEAQADVLRNGGSYTAAS